MDSRLNYNKMAADDDTNVNERLHPQPDINPSLHQDEASRGDQDASTSPLPAVSPARHQPAHSPIPRPRQPRTMSRTRLASGLSPEAAETVPRFLHRISNAPKRRRAKTSTVRKHRFCRRDLSSLFQAMAEGITNQLDDNLDWLLELPF